MASILHKIWVLRKHSDAKKVFKFSDAIEMLLQDYLLSFQKKNVRFQEKFLLSSSICCFYRKRFLKKEFFFAALLGLFLAGCIPSGFRNCTFSLRQTDFNNTFHQTASSSSFKEGDFVLGDVWWNFFQDPKLNQLIEISLYNHPDIETARLRIHLACQKAREAKSVLYPHFFLMGNINKEKASELSSYLGADPVYYTEITPGLISSIYQLDIWKKNRAQFYAELDRVQAKIAEYMEVKLVLSTAVASVYFDLQENLRRLSINRERLQAKEDLFKLLNQKFTTGVISEFNLFEVDTQVQRLKDLIYQIELSIAIDKHALAALVGNITEACLDFEPSFCAGFEKFPLPSSLSIDLLSRRPDLSALKWYIEANSFEVYVAKAKFYPQIDLMAFVGFQSVDIAKLFTSEALWAFGKMLGNLPLFTAGKLSAELGASRDYLNIAIEDYNSQVLIAVQETADAMSSLQYSDKRLESLNLSVIDAENLLDLTKQRFENGVANRISYLNGVENVLFQKDLKVQVELTRFQSAVELIKAIGGGYHECGS